MLVASRAFLGVAPKPVGQALAGGPCSETQPFSEAIIEAN
jgi:hypothetical protein